MIEIKNLNKTYDRRRKTENRVLRDVSLTLPDKGFVCILGPSGCGKTSLLNAVGGLDVFESGIVSVDGRDLDRSGSRAYEAERNHSFGYIFQNYYLLENHSAAYNVCLGLHSLNFTHAEKIKRVRQALKAVDMERYIRRKVGELSGGQQQRVAIARALARRPRVIFADEPTGNLDEKNTRNICTLLRQASKESLVIMVTHEERIARFFADRIITFGDGDILTDSDSWQRGSLNSGTDGIIYTDGLETSAVDGGAMTLKLFREEGAAPVDMTVAVLKDRIVLKLTDQRMIDLGTPDELPQLAEGSGADLTLDEIENTENEAQTALFSEAEAPEAKAGSGVTLPMMFEEARELKKEKGLRRAGMKIFLILLTVLTLLTVGDFTALSQIDPEDFITTDSHLLLLTIEQGSGLGDGTTTLSDRANSFIHDLSESGLDFDFVPVVSVAARYSATVFPQLGTEAMRFLVPYSYVPATYLDENTLIYGRMPENSQEVVADRTVLEDILSMRDSVVQNTIVDISYFLGEKFQLESRNYALTIVGICDSGEKSMYVSKPALLTLRSGSIRAMSLSEYKETSNGAADGIVLGDDECIVNISAAGAAYGQRIGGVISVGGTVKSYIIRDAVAIPSSDATVIVNDSEIDLLMLDGFSTRSVYLYCENKAEVRKAVNKMIRGLNDDAVLIRLSDPYQAEYNAYSEAVRIRADARSIITATVLAVCLIMLYLLCRTQAQERIKLLAVYRLLGIPKRKLHIIFLLEGVLSSLTAIVPTAAITWAVVALIKTRTQFELPVVLPWQIVVITSIGILIYYLITSVLPLWRLLALPPAQLAAKYDM